MAIEKIFEIAAFLMKHPRDQKVYIVHLKGGMVVLLRDIKVIQENTTIDRIG